LKADRFLFERIMMMAERRYQHVLAHPLNRLSSALSIPERLRRKTNKAALATTLQKNVAVEKQ